MRAYNIYGGHEEHMLWIQNTKMVLHNCKMILKNVVQLHMVNDLFKKNFK